MKDKTDNLQQSSVNDIKVTENVQRLTGEESTNKPDTNIPHPIKQLKCSKCKHTKDCSDFYPSKQYPKRGYQYRCIKCSKNRSIVYHEKNRDTILSKWKVNRDNLSVEQKQEIADKMTSWYRKDIRQRLLDRAKDRSNRLGLSCNLVKEDIVIPLLCPLLNVPFKYGSKHDKWFTYSLDRIDNNIGYVKGNVQVITYMANTMKSQANKEQLLTFAKNIIKLFKDDDIV